MNLKLGNVLAWCGLAYVVVVGGCSLEVPKPKGNGIRILIEDKDSGPQELLKSFTSLANPGFGIFADPTSTSDFNCFGVNITGAGVPSDNQLLAGCNSGDNFRGKGLGLFTRPVPRGQSIEADVPAGTARSIDVYGVYPPTSECGGGSGGSAGYFLGGAIENIFESKSISIPISYSTASISGKITCPNDNNGSNFKIYAYTWGSGQISSMDLTTSGGTLTDLGTAPVTSISTIVPVPGRGYLVGYSGVPNQVQLLAMTSTGFVSDAGTTGVPVTAMSAITVAPNASRMWVFGSSSAESCTLSTSNPLTITPLQSFTPSAGFTDVVIHPNATVAVSITSNSIRSFTIDAATGGFTAVSNFAPGANLNNIVMTPSGGYVYVGDTASGISGYSVNSSTGVLTVTSGSPYVSGGYGGKMVMYPDGTHLYSLTNSNSVQHYVINTSTGALTASGSAVATQSSPNGLGVDPVGAYLYVTSATSSNITIYSIDGTTRDISSVGVKSMPYGPSGIVFLKYPP